MKFQPVTPYRVSLLQRYGVTLRYKCVPTLRRMSAAVHLLELWVRILPGTWATVSRECCMLGRTLCVGTITRPEGS